MDSLRTLPHSDLPLDVTSKHATSTPLMVSRGEEGVGYLQSLVSSKLPLPLSSAQSLHPHPASSVPSPLPLPLPSSVEGLNQDTIRACLPYGIDPKMFSTIHQDLMRSLPHIYGPLEPTLNPQRYAPTHEKTPIVPTANPHHYPEVKRECGREEAAHGKAVVREKEDTSTVHATHANSHAHTHARERREDVRMTKGEDLKTQLAKYHCQHLMRAIRNLRKEEYGLDTIILCDGGHVKAHCCILACASNFLKKVLVDCKDFPAVISMPGISLATMDDLMSCIYYGSLPSTANLINLIDAAQHLGMDSVVAVFRQAYPLQDIKDIKDLSRRGSLDGVGKPGSVYDMGVTGTEGAYSSDVKNQEKPVKRRGNRLDQILYQKLNANHLAPETDLPLPTNPILPENAGILGELLMKNDYSRHGAPSSIYQGIDPGRCNTPLNLSKSKMNTPVLSSVTAASVPSSSTAVCSNSKNTSSSAYLSNAASLMSSNLAAASGISPSAFNLVGFSSLAGSMFSQLPSGTLNPLVNSSAFTSLTPASLNPASLTPVSLTPVSLTPTSLTPASLTPSSLTPASLTPVSTYSPYVSHPLVTTSKGKVSSPFNRSRHSKTHSSKSSSAPKVKPVTPNAPMGNTTQTQLPLYYSLKNPPITQEVLKELYEQLRLNPQLTTSLAGLSTLPIIPNIGNPANIASLQSFQTLFPNLFAASSSSNLNNNNNSNNNNNNNNNNNSSHITSTSHSSAQSRQDLSQPQQTSSSSVSSVVITPSVQNLSTLEVVTPSESGALNLSCSNVPKSSSCGVTEVADLPPKNTTTISIDVTSSSGMHSPTTTEETKKVVVASKATLYNQEPIDYTSPQTSSEVTTETPSTTPTVENTQQFTPSCLPPVSSSCLIPVSNSETITTNQMSVRSGTGDKPESSQTRQMDSCTQTLTSVLAPTSSLINSSVLMPTSALIGKAAFDSSAIPHNVSFTTSSSLGFGTLGLQFTIPSTTLPLASKYSIPSQISVAPMSELKIDSSSNDPVDLSPVSQGSKNGVPTPTTTHNHPSLLPSVVNPPEENVSDSMTSDIDVVGSPSAQDVKPISESLLTSSESMAGTNFHSAMPLMSNMTSDVSPPQLSPTGLLQSDLQHQQLKDSKPNTPDSVEVIEESVVTPDRAAQPGHQRKTMFQAGNMGRKRKGCGECEGCQVVDDCGNCRFCRDKAKFGGPNRLKQVCVYKRCVIVDTDPDDGKKKRKNLNRRKQTRCGSCDGCQRTSDCGDCYACLHNAAAQPPARKKICEMRVCEQQQIEEVRASLNVAEEPSPYSTDSLIAEGVVVGIGSSRTSSPNPDGSISCSATKHKLKLSKKAAKKLNQPFCRVSPSKVRTKYYCGECPGCLTTTPCGNCLYCEDMPKFGGPGRYRQKCVKQLCVYHPRLQALKLSNRSKVALEDLPHDLALSNSSSSVPHQEGEGVATSQPSATSMMKNAMLAMQPSTSGTERAIIEGILHPDSYPATALVSTNAAPESGRMQGPKHIYWNPYVVREKDPVTSVSSAVSSNGHTPSPREGTSPPMSTTPSIPPLGTPPSPSVPSVPGVTFAAAGATHFISTNVIGPPLGIYPITVASPTNTPKLPGASNSYPSPHTHVTKIPFPAVSEGVPTPSPPVPTTSGAAVFSGVPLPSHEIDSSLSSVEESRPSPPAEEVAVEGEKGDERGGVNIPPKMLTTEDDCDDAYDDDDYDMDDSDPSSPPSPPSPPLRIRGRGRSRGRGRGRGRGRPKRGASVSPTAERSPQKLARRGRKRKAPKFTVDPEDHSDFEEGYYDQQSDEDDDYSDEDEDTEDGNQGDDPLQSNHGNVPNEENLSGSPSSVVETRPMDNTNLGFSSVPPTTSFLANISESGQKKDVSVVQSHYSSYLERGFTPPVTSVPLVGPSGLTLSYNLSVTSNGTPVSAVTPPVSCAGIESSPHVIPLSHSTSPTTTFGNAPLTTSAFVIATSHPVYSSVNSPVAFPLPHLEFPHHPGGGSNRSETERPEAAVVEKFNQPNTNGSNEQSSTTSQVSAQIFNENDVYDDVDRTASV